MILLQNIFRPLVRLLILFNFVKHLHLILGILLYFVKSVIVKKKKSFFLDPKAHQIAPLFKKSITYTKRNNLLPMLFILCKTEWVGLFIFI